MRPAPAIAALLLLSGAAQAQTYSFDPSEYQKKAFEIGGYAEGKLEGFALDRGSAFYGLNKPAGDRPLVAARGSAAAEIAAKYHQDMLSLAARLHVAGQRDTVFGNSEDTKFYEALVGLQPSTDFSIELGKKVMRWGKGYAWNPVGFVERPKDPTDPELSREGFWMATADYVRSFDGPIQAFGFTPVVIPSGKDVNSRFGTGGSHVDVAAKIYLLALDTDIDLMALSGAAKPSRFGADFSRNFGSELELHGEIAQITESRRPILLPGGAAAQITDAALSYLLGARYVTESETTFILEYYRNGEGFSTAEERSFFAFAHASFDAFQGSGASLFRAQNLAGAYGRQNPLRHYINLRVSQNEPFGIVYLTPALTVITDAQDRSAAIIPETIYTGFRNIELRLRMQINVGARLTEFGEKQANERIEFRLRYFF